MPYQMWFQHNVRPNKRELSHKGKLVTYQRGEQGSKEANLAHVKKYGVDRDGATFLGAAVDGKIVKIVDKDWMEKRAYIEGGTNFR